MLTLGCGPSGEIFIVIFAGGSALLIGLKAVLYYAFISAFRFRVAAAVPMSRGRVGKLTLFRLLAGTLIMLTWALLFAAPEPSTALPVLWAVSIVERMVIWLCLGYWGAQLRGRRLVGWTISGTAIDAACDGLLAGFAFDPGLIVVILGVLPIFIAVLHHVGRRNSLINRFSTTPHCSKCNYDLTGNLSGVCPECGQLVRVSIDEINKAMGRRATVPT